MKATEPMTFTVPTTIEEYGKEALDAGSLTCAPDGSLEYDPGDAGIYDTSTPEGRRAWKANAPEGVARIVMEDGEPWLDAVVDSFRECLTAWAEGRGVII